MRFVAIKSQVQQDMMALHRVRSLLIRERTALMNEMRGLLAEYGVVVAQGAVALRRALATIVEDHEARVSDLLREILSEMSERLRLFEERLKRYDLRITEVKDGNILLSVHTEDGKERDRAKKIFETGGAVDISYTGEASVPKEQKPAVH